MIKDNQRHFNRLHVIIDAIATAGCYLLAWVIRFLVLQGDPGLPFADYCWMLVPLVPYTLFVYFAFNLYTPKRVKGRRLEAGGVMQANLVVVITIIVCLQIFNKQFPKFTEDFSLYFYYYIIRKENRQVAKCRILKRFGENFVKNVGRGRNMVCRKNFKFGFVELFDGADRYVFR